MTTASRRSVDMVSRGASGLFWIESEPSLGGRVLAGEDVPAGVEWLSPGEQEVLRGLRLPKRRGDWLLGRWTAKRVIREYLGESGVDGAVPAERDISIVAASDGAPEVVLAGREMPVELSIAHSGGRALAVVGPRGAVFGADLETIEPRSAAFVEDFFTTAERTWVEAIGERDRAWGACLIWSAKEAVLKALRVGLREDTRAVEIEVPEGVSPGAGFTDPVGTGDGMSRWHRIGARVVATGQRFEGVACVREGQVLVIVTG